MRIKTFLTEDENTELKEILEKSPCLTIAYELKEEFRNIYNTSTTVKMGQRRFEKWLVAARCLFPQVESVITLHL